jgi:hypothetical protein
MSSRQWKRTRATVELCARRRRHRDGTRGVPGELVRWGATRLNHRDRYRYALTFSYPVAGDLYITDAVSNTPLKEGSKVIVQYDPLDPRINSLNHPPREHKNFMLAVSIAGVAALILLVIAICGL